jgi:hypothetical protein
LLPDGAEGGDSRLVNFAININSSFLKEDIKRERSWIALNASYLASLLQEEKVPTFYFV